jgi:hypothetical protein
MSMNQKQIQIEFYELSVATGEALLYQYKLNGTKMNSLESLGGSRLINMRSRAESLDGEFVIDSEVGKQQ